MSCSLEDAENIQSILVYRSKNRMQGYTVMILRQMHHISSNLPTNMFRHTELFQLRSSDLSDYFIHSVQAGAMTGDKESRL